MKLKLRCLIYLVLFLLSSCKAKNIVLDNKIYGTWNLVGYGQQVEIAKKRTTLYNTYEGGCNIHAKLPTRYINQLYTLTALKEDSLQLKQGYTEYNYFRSPESEYCKSILSRNTPLLKYLGLILGFAHIIFAAYNFKK